MKKLLVLAVLLGASFTTLTFAQEEVTTTDENLSGTVITTTGDVTTGSAITWHKAKRQEKRAQQLQKKEQIMQKKAVKVGKKAERLRGIVAKINNGFLTSIIGQLDHLANKAKTEESKQMILDIKLLIQDKLGLLNVDEDGNVIDEIEDEDENTVSDDDEDEDETEDEVEDEVEDEDDED